TLFPARSWIIREPLGVVLIIGTWNYPVQLTLMPLVAAIAAGNCVIVKPSEVSAATSAALARLMPVYLDSNCIGVVEGGANETAALLNEKFNHIFYTGGARVGKIVAQAAAQSLTPVTLELGGKSPCIVDETANIEVAARRIAFGKFLNAGQTCIAPDYVLVHACREEELLAALKRAITDFYGDKPHSSPDYARIVNDQHFDRVSRLLVGNEVFVGAETDRESHYIAPTLLRRVDAESPVMSEEVFGPVLPVLTVSNLSEAIDFVNARPKPLALYLFTESRKAERAVLTRTSSGGVCINSTLMHHVNERLPFGGVGDSGFGNYHGRFGFETFSHQRAVLRKPARPDIPLAYPRYTRVKDFLLRWIL
ncbi:MAG TPA: aldehyde dehydrogenase family protein, partial [Terriglobales bacterium]|nr:aldehyde dehydrogenase family protein [Terriglobales bacterium]